MEFALQTTDIILLLLFGVGTFFLARWTIKIYKRSRIIVYAVSLQLQLARERRSPDLL